MVYIYKKKEEKNREKEDSLLDKKSINRKKYLLRENKIYIKI